MLISAILIHICSLFFLGRICHLICARRQITGEEKWGNFKGIDLIVKYR